MKFVFPAQLEPEKSGGFVVTFRDVPEAITQGDTLEEALANAADALEEAIAAYIDDEDALPSASAKRKAEHWVQLPLQTALKAALYEAVKAQGMGKAELARRLSVDEKEARRILDPHHETKVRRMEAALLALGKRTRFEVQDAA